MKRHGGEKRGSSHDRRVRKLWLLAAFGDGETCPCAHCKAVLTYATLESDRIVPGGSYARHNVQPSCGACNRARSNNPAWQYA